MRVSLLRAVAMVLAAALATPVDAQGTGGNRMWWGDVRLTGPLEEVRFFCGEDGEVRLRADLLAGEDRTIAIPLPVRSPLGIDGLLSVPMPAIEDVVPEGTRGKTFWLGWSSEQPSERVGRLSPALRGRSRPAADRSEDDLPGAAELTLAVAAFLVAFSFRRRKGGAAVAVVVGIVAGGALFGIRTVREIPERRVRVHEIDLGIGQGLAVEACGRADVQTQRLEVAPEHSALLFELELTPSGVRGTATRAPGASVATRLWVLEIAPVDRWNRAASPVELAEAWVRGAGGEWTAHGAWRAGEPLGPTQSGAPAAPGWLAAGLPPGRDVLLGRLPAGSGPTSYLRVLGF